MAYELSVPPYELSVPPYEFNIKKGLIPYILINYKYTNIQIYKYTNTQIPFSDHQTPLP